MKQSALRTAVCAVFCTVLGATVSAAPPDHARNARAIERLQAETGGADVRVSPATGKASFVRIPPGLARKAAASTPQALETEATAFVSRHAEAFGLQVGSTDLKLRKTERDKLGKSHLTYVQEYAGLPVFGAQLKVHFDENDGLTVVTGTLIPDIAVSAAPSRSIAEVEDAAVRFVEPKTDSPAPTARRSRLLIYREGLAKGVVGDNHLAYEVEVGNGIDVREFVYVSAHTGKVIDQITGTPDGMNRRAYDGMNLPTVPAGYPNSPFWVEGAAFPTGVTEADNMILASQETYDLFANAFGRDSFDGEGATMDSIFNRGYNCPNASWNGAFISFCPGLTTDDVTGHEWAHAYTEYTDGLIYAWQPGALNEAASDIFGETLDRINGRDDILPDGPRTAGECSVFTTLPPSVTVNAPPAIAGVKSAGSAAFGPQNFDLTAELVEVDDGVDTGNDGCEVPFTSDVNGKIAFMDRGVCGFAVKVKNAQDSGAIAAIIGNNQGGTAIINMGGADPTITIPSLSVVQNDGTAIKGALATDTVNLSMSRGATGSDNSTRWLVGEDSTAVGLTGALRDMSTPGCYGNAGKVTDSAYHCAASDNGGVHLNSGVDNHAYALMVDGGNFNGQTISGIGLTKAANVYFRAKTHYQGPATNFAEHADALEQACTDLVGSNLSSLTDGTPSGEVISAGDCQQVAKAIAAVEMRTPPTQCGFEPLLAQDPPPLCASPAQKRKVLLADSFDNGNASMDRWNRSHDGTTQDFTPREWSVVADLPGDRPGKAFFGPDANLGTCLPGGDETAVLHLDSPEISVPASVGSLRMAFDHWVATEAGWDGGNLKISVNGGPWQLVAPGDFIYNPYNAALFSAAQGNSNPIAGEPAFTGADEGSVSGSWGRSIIDLAPYAKAKDKIRLRFDMGNDACFGTFGWYVDDLSVYVCR